MSSGDIVVHEDLIVPPHAANGVKIMSASGAPGTNAWSWLEMIGRISVRGTGPNDPDFVAYHDNHRQYQFVVNDEVFVDNTLPNDYAPGTDLYYQIHWSHAGALVTGGSITIGLDVAYAKSHNQASLPASKTITLVSNASTTMHQQMCDEVRVSDVTPDATHLDQALLEVDGILLTRVYLVANNMTVSGGGVPDPFIHFANILYQSRRWGTKNRSPDFYA